MVRSFAAFKKTDKGEESTQGKRYFTKVLGPAYRNIFFALEGREPKNKEEAGQLRVQTRPLYKAMVAAFGQGLFPSDKLEACAGLLDNFEIRMSMQGSQMQNIPNDVLLRVMMFLSIVETANLRKVARRMARVALQRPILSLKYRNISFGEVVDFMSPYQQMGLHGSSSTHRMSMYKGIRLPQEKEKVYTTSQLGPGFYLTQGKKEKSSVDYALSVAKESVKTHKGDPYLFRIFMRDVDKMTSEEVPEEAWANMEKDTMPESLTPYLKKYDYLTAPIVKVEHVPQIKINAHALESLLALPPLNRFNYAYDEDILEWLEALASAYKI